ncbi:MAG TPA: hydrogenase maturation protease [Pseudonocardia sp.]|jgi:hydrogenase maturation protease|nr:hydrogenase maturation protease [Pseudonocardia sp.]
MSNVLVAGVGNVLKSDDGFGVEVIRRLARQQLPPDVEVVDIGIRAMHLAYQLLDGYRALLIVDATERGGSPGELYLLEHDLSGTAEADQAPVGIPDAHGMTPDAVLALLGSLATASGQEATAGLRRVLVLGCEPATVEDGIGLSEPVAASVDRATRAVHKVLAELAATPDHPGTGEEVST